MRSQGGGANHWQRDQPYGGGGRGGGIPENPTYYNQPHGGAGRNPSATQWNHGGGARGSGNNQWHQDGGGQRGAARQPHSNTRKINLNLFYCYSCGYDVNHARWQCQYKKNTHIPNVPRDEAHTVAGASMKAQHKHSLMEGEPDTVGSWQDNYARRIESWTRTDSGNSNISGKTDG